MMDRSAHAIYCDDIRLEVGGKLSYMGVYSNRLIVASFPFTLPKLCIAVQVESPDTKPFQSLTIKVLKDYELFKEFPVTSESLSQALENSESEEDRNSTFQVIGVCAVFAPFHIEKPCTIRVRVQTESEELKALALKITGPSI